MEPINSEIFPDDAMFVEADIGNILGETGGGRVRRCRNLSGKDSIDDAKTALEGDWPTSGLVLGFNIDTVAATISAPLLKIEGSRTFILGADFVGGHQRISLVSLQTLSGYMRCWLLASMYCAICARPIDLLTAYSNEGIIG